MSNLLVKSVVGPDTHCVNLLDEILCHGPDSLSLVSGGHEVCFNAAILCSLSPLLSTLVNQSTQDNGCSAKDHIFVFLPQLRNWKTMKHLKTFLSNGMVGNISRLEMEDLRNLLQMLGFNICCEEHRSLMQQAEVGGEEEQFFAQVKYEAEDEEELLGKQDFFTRIQLDRNHYEELKNLIGGGSGDMSDRDIVYVDQGGSEVLSDRDIMDVDQGGSGVLSDRDIVDVDQGGSGVLSDRDIVDFGQEVMNNEDLEIEKGSGGTLQTSNTNDNYTEVDCIEQTKTKFTKAENKLSKCSKRLTKQKIRPKRNLPNLKTKYSDCEITENVCPKGKSVKKNATVDRKGVQYQCPKCNYKSKRKSNVKNHCDSVNEGVKYPCSKCDYKATQPGHLKRHIKAVHEGVKYPCSKCDYKATQSNLKLHIKAVHEGVKYPCSKCDYKATHPSSLKHHIKAVHEGVKYPCPKCDYKARQLSSLKLHIKAVHEGVKFSCNECDYKGFHLMRHIKSAHNGIRYSCSECDYATPHRRNFVSHNKAVHGVKYLCTKCDFKSTRLSRLKPHKKSAH